MDFKPACNFVRRAKKITYLSLLNFFLFCTKRGHDFQVALDDDREEVAISGARLNVSADTRVALSDMTICSRFNLQILGGYEGNTNLWYIADPRNETKVRAVQYTVHKTEREKISQKLIAFRGRPLSSSGSKSFTQTASLALGTPSLRGLMGRGCCIPRTSTEPRSSLVLTGGCMPALCTRKTQGPSV